MGQYCKIFLDDYNKKHFKKKEEGFLKLIQIQKSKIIKEVMKIIKTIVIIILLYIIFNNTIYII